MENCRPLQPWSKHWGFGRDARTRKPSGDDSSDEAGGGNECRFEPSDGRGGELDGIELGFGRYMASWGLRVPSSREG